MVSHHKIVMTFVTQPHDEAAVSKDGPTARKEKKRSRNFSVNEDKLLVSCWLNMSIDPIHGTDQALGTYCARIHKYFHANKNFEFDQSQGSLINHWSGIQHDINVFCGCILKIEARNQSGCSIDDKVCEHSLFYSFLLLPCCLLFSTLQIPSACALFMVDDKFHRIFPYMYCWKILKDQPKWIERCNHMNAPKPTSKKKKTSTKSSPSSVIPNTNGDADDS
jgi:hypothetical protein